MTFIPSPIDTQTSENLERAVCPVCKKPIPYDDSQDRLACPEHDRKTGD